MIWQVFQQKVLKAHETYFASFNIKGREIYHITSGFLFFAILEAWRLSALYFLSVWCQIFDLLSRRNKWSVKYTAWWSQSCLIASSFVTNIWYFILFFESWRNLFSHLICYLTVSSSIDLFTWFIIFILLLFLFQVYMN